MCSCSSLCCRVLACKGFIGQAFLYQAHEKYHQSDIESLYAALPTVQVMTWRSAQRVARYSQSWVVRSMSCFFRYASYTCFVFSTGCAVVSVCEHYWDITTLTGVHNCCRSLLAARLATGRNPKCIDPTVVRGGWARRCHSTVHRGQEPQIGNEGP